MYREQSGLSLSCICRLAGVSRQSYYQSKASDQARLKVVDQVLELVKSVRMQMPKLGTRKLYHLLQEPLKALKVGRDKLFTILRANHLLIAAKRAYHRTTDSFHRFRKHKNTFQTLQLDRAEQAFVADITYVGTAQHPLYLALVTDAYSKRIMGYDLSTNLAAKGAVNALKKAIKNRWYPQQPLLHHSDRGTQYCCEVYQRLLRKATITCSMTQVYDPYENAIAERVNGILKQELLPSRTSLARLGLKTARKVVRQAIDIYNQQRPHWSCHLKTPEQMHRMYNQLTPNTYKKGAS